MTPPQPLHFTLTEAAATHLSSVLAERPGHALRLAVRGGGCAGLEYDFLLIPEADIEADDHVVLSQDSPGCRMVIDPVSAPYLEHCELDYANELFSARFVIRNPNTKAVCGCGRSFSG